jgi:cyclopropane fatty-acyl-phospholipid synthase-like methyltransferase
MRNKQAYLSCLEKILSDRFPITQRNIIITCQSLIDDDYTILDIGCGLKLLTKLLVCKKLIGIDIWADYLTDDDIAGDIRQLDKLIEPKSFDVVIAIDIIEHLTEEEGLKLLCDMENIARKKIIIVTPTYWSSNVETIKDPKIWSYNNPYNYHKSFWSVEDFFKQGYAQIPVNLNNELLFVIKEICDENAISQDKV